MTNDLQPGSALDAAVHAALGRTITLAQRFGGQPPYSTDANAALEAYEETRKRGWRIAATKDYLLMAPPVEWCVELTRESGIIGGFGPSFASALCTAIVEASKR